MGVYESAQHAFSIQYPLAWTEGPPQPGTDAVASFVDGQGGSLSITEEDTEALSTSALSCPRNRSSFTPPLPTALMQL